MTPKACTLLPANVWKVGLIYIKYEYNHRLSTLAFHLTSLINSYPFSQENWSTSMLIVFIKLHFAKMIICAFDLGANHHSLINHHNDKSKRNWWNNCLGQNIFMWHKEKPHSVFTSKTFFGIINKGNTDEVNKVSKTEWKCLTMEFGLMIIHVLDIMERCWCYVLKSHRWSEKYNSFNHTGLEEWKSDRLIKCSRAVYALKDVKLKNRNSAKREIVRIEKRRNYSEQFSIIPIIILLWS